jgi:hypothetical protein
VEADNRDEAETRALAILREHPWLASLRGHPRASRARVFFEEITEVPADTVPVQTPGLTLYPMDDEPPG